MAKSVIRSVVHYLKDFSRLQLVILKSRRICAIIAGLRVARVVKLVDAGDSKSPAARRAGSIPAPGTTDSKRGSMAIRH